MCKNATRYSTLVSELLDVLNAAGLPTGRTKRRDAVHQSGDLHRTLHVWLLKDRQNVLLQRRAMGKDLEPGKLDVAVGGHFSAGETLPDVLRETREELGFDVSPHELIYLGITRAQRRYPGAIDNELQETYLLLRDAPLESYRLAPDEVDVLYELPLAGAVALFEHGTPLAAAGFDAYGRQNNALLIAADLIEPARKEAATRLKQIQAWVISGEMPEPIDL